MRSMRLHDDIILLRWVRAQPEKKPDHRNLRLIDNHRKL